MTDIALERINIQQEETAYRASVSESTFSRFGAAVNFINKRQHTEKQFFANGKYNILGAQNDVDGRVFFQYDAEIIDIWAFCNVAGSGGTTQMDVKRATSSGGSFSSIFSTKPAIQASAGDNVYIHVGSSISNTTAPVLSTTNVNAGDALRFDLTSVQSGNPQNCGIVIHYRPR